jgi:tetratricopeptide (TPR) repeat protein
MMNAIIQLSITLIISFFSVLVLWLNYKKEKAEDQNAKIKFAKRLLIVGVIIVALSMVVTPLVNLFSQKEEPATKKDIKRLEDLISRLSEPTKKEVESEINKQSNVLFEKKKRALLEYQKGVSSYKSYNFITAIGHFDTAINIFTIPSFYVSRGNCYALNSQFDRAISDYSEAIQLNPNYADAYNNRGVIWHKKGDQDKAIADFNIAIQLNPNFAEAYNNRGGSWLLKGNNVEALVDYDKAIQLNSNYTEAYGNRGLVWSKKGNDTKALADFNKAIQLNPKYATAYNNRGALWKKKGDINKAIDDYNKAIQLNPNYAEAYNNRGNAWSIKGDINKALADFNMAIQLNPNLAEAYNNRKNAQLRQRRD